MVQVQALVAACRERMVDKLTVLSASSQHITVGIYGPEGNRIIAEVTVRFRDPDLDFQSIEEAYVSLLEQIFMGLERKNNVLNN